MRENPGKRFEKQWKNSSPEYTLVYRLPDSALSFGGKNNYVRFTKKNPFDYLMWDSKRKHLFALELKSVKGKAISFERCKDETGIIHYHQIEGLKDWNRYDGIECGFLIEFREIEKTIYISIESFLSLISNLDKKSFNVNELDDYGVDYIEIPQKKLRVNYKYDIESFLDKF